MKIYLIKALLVVFITAITSVCFADAETGDRSFTISGTGTGDKDFDNSAFGATASIGWYRSPALELGVRQSVSWVEREREGRGDTNDLNGSTRAFVDYHFRQGAKFRPYLGGSLGYIYGDNTEESFIAGPEVGFKYYLQEKAFINTSLEYQFLFDDGDDADDNFDDGVLIYGLGLGIHF